MVDCEWIIQMAHKEGNEDLSKESKHPSEFQIHVQHLTEEKSGLCCQLLSGSNYKEIKELFSLAWPTVFSYFFYHMVNMISLFFAGRVGEVELAAAVFYRCDRTFTFYWFKFCSGDTLFSSIWSKELSPCWCSAAKRSLDFRINLYLSLVTMG